MRDLLASRRIPKPQVNTTQLLRGDLDGDDKLEMLVRTGYYEGGGMQVWQLRSDKLVKVIEMDCGV